jgi:hypothetical protein
MSQEVAGTLGGPLLVILKSNTLLLSGAGQKHAHGDKSQEMIFTQYCKRPGIRHPFLG